MDIVLAKARERELYFWFKKALLYQGSGYHIIVVERTGATTEKADTKFGTSFMGGVGRAHVFEECFRLLRKQVEFHEAHPNLGGI